MSASGRFDARFTASGLAIDCMSTVWNIESIFWTVSAVISQSADRGVQIAGEGDPPEEPR